LLLKPLIDVAALEQQPGQPAGGSLVAGVGAGAQLIQVTAVAKKLGQLPGSSLSVE